MGIFKPLSPNTDSSYLAMIIKVRQSANKSTKNTTAEKKEHKRCFKNS